MKTLRVLVLAILMVGTIALAAAAWSAKVDTVRANSRSSEIASALGRYELNAAGAENVYQQQVTAIWGAKDLLEVVAHQNDDLLQAQSSLIGEQRQTNALLKYLVGALAFMMCGIAIIGAVLLDRRWRPGSDAVLQRSGIPDVTALTR